MISTLGSCGLGHGLGFGDTAGVVLVTESSVKSIISIVSYEHDAFDVLAVPVVVAVGGCGSTLD